MYVCAHVLQGAEKNLRCCPSQVQSVHCCLVCLVGWLVGVFVFVVVVFFVCFVLFEAGFLTDLEFVG